ncbi:MAG: gluconokinase [Firmicutes bacterium]|nr:gluconokinase [Bacillota bacterium]
MKYYLGVDVGTSGCRAVAFNEEFRVLAGASKEYAVISPRPGWAEQDPELILESVVEVLKRVLTDPAVHGEKPVAVGMATFMHSLIGLDGDGKPLTNAIIWADLRSAREAEWLKDHYGVSEIYGRTGCPIHPMYLPAKVLWLKRNAPDVFSGMVRIVSIKEYLLYRLTGKFLVDHSIASATGLLNIRTLKWDEFMLDAVGVDAGLLSEPVSPLTVVEGFTTDYARSKGLPAGVPLVLGATDGTLSNPGSGVVLPGQLAAMIGTSAAVRVTTPEPVLDPKARTWCYYLATGKWITGGATNNGGNILRWYRDHFGSKEIEQARTMGVDPYQVLSRQAASVPPGSRGLVFLPFLAGERSPYWNPNARGVLFGLNLGHGPDEVIRSIMEGVVFQLYSVYEALVETTGQPAEVRASGGFVKSPEWVQIMADTFGVPLAVPQVLEGSAFGAAALAMMAMGVLEKLEDVSRFIQLGKTVEPVPARTAIYRELYEIYTSIYKKLNPESAQIAEFQAGKGDEAAS